MRIYLSGKMTGLPLMNYPAFHAEAARLRELGYEVENPAENPQQDSWAAYMKQSCAQMLTCDAIAVLPNWSLSKGARIEVQLAAQCGMEFFYADHLREPPGVAGGMMLLRKLRGQRHVA